MLWETQVKEETLDHNLCKKTWTSNTCWKMQCIEKLYKPQQRVGKYASKKLTLINNIWFFMQHKMDSQNASYNVGQAKGQAQVYLQPLLFVVCWCSRMLNIQKSLKGFCMILQEKASNMMDKASDAANSAQDSMQQVLLLFVSQLLSKSKHVETFMFNPYLQ